jgi:hypothetical protein
MKRRDITDDDKPVGDTRCDTCNKCCDLVYEDCGFGTTEAWGYVTNHEDWQWRSRCCGDTFSVAPAGRHGCYKCETECTVVLRDVADENTDEMLWVSDCCSYEIYLLPESKDV